MLYPIQTLTAVDSSNDGSSSPNLLNSNTIVGVDDTGSSSYCIKELGMIGHDVSTDPCNVFRAQTVKNDDVILSNVKIEDMLSTDRVRAVSSRGVYLAPCEAENILFDVDNIQEGTKKKI